MSKQKFLSITSSWLTPPYELFDKKSRDFILVVVYGLSLFLRRLYHRERNVGFFLMNFPLLMFVELSSEIDLLRFVLLSSALPSLNFSNSLLIS